MEKQSNISKFKKEFQSEINASKVSLEILKNSKIPNEALEAEVFLRKVFGDEIFERKLENFNIEGEKEIIKLNEDDLSFDTEVQQICENLVDPNFDAGLNVVLAKIAEQEEEWGRTF